MKKKKLFWIIPLSLLVITLIFFSTIKYKKAVCGDGICQEEEIIEGVSFCDIDCAEICLAPTGAIEGDIEENCSIGWDNTYINLAEKGLINKDFLRETSEIDFSNPEILKLAQELKRDTPKETARAIAKWTFQNIYYDRTDTYFDCINVKASDVLKRETGVCSTMSKLNIALLRANGIPAHSITGCFNFITSCRLKQTFFGIRPFVQFINITIDETGHAPTLGFLHNWVVIKIIEDGEVEDVVLESTAGQLYEDSCIDYRKYYKAPSDSLACGLSRGDANLQDCIDWVI